MDFAPGISPGINTQALSNGCSTLYGSEAPNIITDSLAQLKITGNPSESIANMASNVQLLEAEDISIALKSTNILEIVFDYALNKFDDCRDRLEAGRFKFISVEMPE
jgi:hypothetical protein